MGDESVNDPASRPTIRQGRHDGAVPSPDAIGEQFPQLEVLEVIGRGGMGIVYRARQKSLDRTVALKILPPDTEHDASFAERFNREARALARLQHPNIVTIHDSGQVGELYYFIMEFVDGRNLRDMMGNGSLAPAEALAIIPPICDALEYAHSEGIAHRDIKPENILIDTRGRVKIADFGLAKLLASNETNHALTLPQQSLGTMHYMAPEQIERPSQVDHRADIYALGVVFYELLTGELPIGRFPLPSERSPIDARLDDIVLRALEKEPDRRYQHVSDIKTDVESLSSGATPVTPPAPAAQPADAGQAAHGFATPPPGAAAPTYVPTPFPGPPLVGTKSPAIAYLLWLLCFVGFCGIHRFYAGRWITGILWVLTGGLLWIGQIIDLFLIPGMINESNIESQLMASVRAQPAGQPPGQPSQVTT